MINKFKGNAFFFNLVLLVISLGLPNKKVSSFLLITLILVWLLEGDLKSKFKNILTNKILCTFILFYFIHIIGLLNTENLSHGVRILEKKLSFLFLPALIYTSNGLSVKKVYSLLIIFALTCTIVGCYGLINVYQLNELEWQRFFTFSRKDYRLALENFIRIHPTYFSAYLIFSIHIFIYFILKPQTNLISKFSLGLGVFINIGVICLLVSRTPMFILFSSLVICGLYFIYIRRKFLIGFAVMFFLMFGAFYLVWTVPSVKSRFEELLIFKSDKFQPATGNRHYSVNVRVGMLVCAKELIQQNWIFGTGTGDIQDKLNACYKENGYSDVMYIWRMNVHNQYLQYFISLGIFGFLFFLIFLFYPLVPAIKNKDYLFMLFIYLIVICCLTESIFESNKGIIFFSLFQGLFLLMQKYPKENSLPVQSLNN
jgi:O-antigen ligase